MSGFITGEQSILEMLNQLNKENDELRAKLAKLEEDLDYRVYRLETLLLSHEDSLTELRERTQECAPCFARMD